MLAPEEIAAKLINILNKIYASQARGYSLIYMAKKLF